MLLSELVPTSSSDSPQRINLWFSSLPLRFHLTPLFSLYKKTPLHAMLSRLVFLVALVGLESALVIQAQDVSPLSPDQITDYAPYTHYSGAAFCDQSQILTWSCGGDFSFGHQDLSRGTFVALLFAYPVV